ncbi:MAG: protein-glutamate methylesterase/protein-glutamine glutaminase [Limisphaerales bacterium]
MNKLIRTLIVDDSAFVRKVVREMLSRSPYIEVVGAARDGKEALEMVEELKPDVVTCDLMMPQMSGVEFVREQMARRPLPILVLSMAPENGNEALEALEAGATDFVKKPTALANNELLTVRDELIEKVKAASLVNVDSLIQPAFEPIKIATPKTSRVGIVVIGISTGGPQALRHFLPLLPEDFPVPIAIVLHMPIGYTNLFAQKLDEISKLEVVEAKEGVSISPGRIVLAQAGRHLTVRRGLDDMVRGHLSLEPIDSLHRPCADVLFQSAAEVYGDAVLGVVMTGMGKDGKEGAAWIKAKGGSILTEAEESCVIFGMPRAVAEAGLSDASAPLKKMAQAIIERI